jgi:branched-chain amino acid transport system ATP-binding protein
VPARPPSSTCSPNSSRRPPGASSTTGATSRAWRRPTWRGSKRALEIATTLALEPELLLLDEPMAGLGNEDIGRISALIRDVAKTRTVLMVEHNLSVVADLSHTITVLTRGRVLAEGNYAEVSKNPEVREAYMGTGTGHA